MMMTQMTIPDAIQRLAMDHLNARRTLNTLERQVDALAQYQNVDPEVIAAVLAFFDENDGHHSVEDMMYLTLRHRAPHIGDEIDAILDEHTMAAGKLAAFAETARLLQRDVDTARHAFCRTARTFISFERHHILQEESRFFRYALEYLTQDDWLKIDWGIRDADAQSHHGMPMMVLKSA